MQPQSSAITQRDQNTAQVGEVSPCLQPLRGFRHPLCGETPQRPDSPSPRLGRSLRSLPPSEAKTTLLSSSTTLLSSVPRTVAPFRLDSQILRRVVVWISILVINVFTCYSSRSQLTLHAPTSRVPSSSPFLLERG